MRVERFIAGSWSGAPLGVEDFEELVKASPTQVGAPDPGWGAEFCVLRLWGILLGGGGMVLANRPR